MKDIEIPIEENEGICCITNQLCDAIQNSDIYKKYKECYDRISENHELMGMVNNVRRNNFFSTNSGYGRMSYDEYHNVYNGTRMLRQNNKLVSEFLDAELELARLIQDINMKLMMTVDFNCDFLN